jgi:hypothetical protein
VSAGTVTFVNGTSFTLTVSGSLTFLSSTVFAGGLTFNATTTGKTVSFGTSLNASVTFNGVGGGWTLGSAYNNPTNILTVTNGTFDTSSVGNYAVTTGSISSNNSNARTINLNASTVTLSSNAPITFTTSTNFTLNTGTSTINCSGAAPIFAGNGLTFYNVAFTSTVASTISITGANTFNNLSITANTSTGFRVLCTFGANQTINGILSTTGTAGNRRIFFSNSIGFTLTINSAPNLTDADFGNTYVVGTAAPISGTRIGNLGNCSGITFSTPKNCYWVSSGSSYHTGNNIWSATDAGVGSTDYQPLPQDTAIFTNSRRGAFVSQNDPTGMPYIGAVNCSAVTSAFTFSISGALSVYGNLTMGSGVTAENYNSFINFLGNVNGGSQVITSAGKQLGSMGVNTANTGNGTVVLADAYSATYASIQYAIYVTTGTFNTAGYAVTADSISSSGTTVRTINFGASTLTLNSSAPINFSASTNLTFNAGTSTINCSSSVGTLNGSGQTFYNVTFTGNNFNYNYAITGTNTFNNLSFAATLTGQTGNQIITISANQTINGTLTFGGTSEIRRRFVNSNSVGTPRTLTVNSLSANYCDFRDIVIAGAASGSSPTNAGDCGGNSGIIFPAPKTVYWNLTGATQDFTATGWATSSGGTPAAANFPLAQDTAIFDNTGVAGTITIPSTGASNFWNFGTVDASLRTNAMTLTNSASTNIFGNWKYGTGVTSGNTNSLYFSKNGTQTITSNGVTFGSYVRVANPAANVQLTDALSISATAGLLIDSGTFDAVAYNVTAGTVTNSAGVNAVLKMGSGTWTLSGTGTVWSNSSTIFPGTANIILSGTSTTARTFGGGSGYYNKLTIGGATGISTTTITGSNVFTELASTKIVAHTIDFGTSTQGFGKWSVTGTAGNVVTITGTSATNNILGPAVTGVDYLAMGTWGIGTTSPGEFYAGANSTGTAAAPVYRTAAPAPRTLYWVGGTGNWSSTTKWSTSSGGASGAAIPTSLDSVIIDHAGQSIGYSVTVDTGVIAARCANFTTLYWVGGIAQLAGSVLTYFHGNVTTGSAGTNVTHTGQIHLVGNSSHTLTYGGVTWGGSGCQLVLSGPNATWTLGSALTIGGSVGLTQNSGTFNTNGYALSAYGIQSSNSYVRTINLSNSTVTVTGSSITFTTSTNLTLNSGTSQINFISSATTSHLGGLTYYNVSYPGYNSHTINGTNTFNNLTFAGRTALIGISLVNFGANQTINGTLTVGAGLTAAYRTMICSSTLGTSRILTVNAISSLTDVDFRDITIVATPPVIPSISFNTPGAQTWTVPAGLTSVTIKLWGGGGGSGGSGYMEGGGGGGGGAFASKVLTVTPAQVLSFTVGTGGGAGGYSGFGQTVGATGTASTYSAISAGGGAGGGDGVGGAGGTASGGDVNTSGQAGIYGGSPIYSNGGLAGNSPNATAARNVVPYSGLQPGGGQRGGGNDFAGNGGDGRVTFEWSAIPLSLPVTGTRLGNAKGNTNITFPAAKTVYYRQTGSADWGTDSGSWSATSGGSADATMFPLAQDTAVFPADTYPASGSTTTINAAYNIGTINMSARTSNTMTLATGTATPPIYGNWINGTGTTLTGTGIMTFAGRVSQTITSAGRTFTQSVSINNPGDSVTLQDGFTSSNSSGFALAIFSGTFDANNYNVTFSGTSTSAVQITGSTPTIAIGSGTWTISTAWNMAATAPTITGSGTLSMTAAAAKTFTGGGFSYSGVTLNQGGAGTLTITGNNTFANITNTSGVTTTISLGTTTQTVGAFTAAGTAGNLLTITGTSAASTATLIYTGSGSVSGLNYLVPTFIRAYPLTGWNAVNSTNGGTAGWTFSAATAPTSNGKFFLMFN